MYERVQQLARAGEESCFLWGPRQTGKSTLLKQRFPASPCYDLLLSDQYERLNRRPMILREEILGMSPIRMPVIVDEVQKIPALLDEIQWLIVNHGVRFILCGSSARKLKRGGGNLLGGRALRYEMFPLVSREIRDFDLLRALNHGLLPRHYANEHPVDLIRAYVGDYLKEEIAAEGLSRNIPAFGRFLESAAFSNGEMVNYRNIASECGVSPPTVAEYFRILTDTLIGRFIPSYRRRPKRRVIQTPKFYFFDVGVANVLLNRGEIVERSESFGRAFEHFVVQEIIAHSHYSGLNYPVAYWRTASQLEVDFILGDHETAVEVKGISSALPTHARGLHAFMEEYRVKRAILVTLDPHPRRMETIDILPWRTFLDRLWNGEALG